MPAPEKDSFTIYQLKHEDVTNDYRFEPYDRLQAAGLAADSAHYPLFIWTTGGNVRYAKPTLSQAPEAKYTLYFAIFRGGKISGQGVYTFSLITDSPMRNKGNAPTKDGAQWPTNGCRVPLLLFSSQAVEILVEHQIFLLFKLLDVYTGVTGIYSPHLVYLGADNHVHFF